MRTRKKVNGYTLIELIIVMVILAILSTVSLRTYADLQDDAKHSGAQGVAGALGSASAANYLLRMTKGPAGTTAITDCADAGALLTSGSLSAYAIASKPIASGAIETCTVDHVKPGPATAATFIAHGIS